jgi:macrocin-O-methyltransferase TylF-like protien
MPTAEEDRLMDAPAVAQRGSEPAAVSLYLDLLKKCLTRTIFAEAETFDPSRRETVPFDSELREEGRDWPSEAETMIGLKRLDNLQELITDVVRQEISGDLIETGVWRGGATIFMRGVLKALGDTTRTVWVADSFAGLPSPDVSRYPIDAGYGVGTMHDALLAPVEDVKRNFARYGLLDDQVRFLQGWFGDTLHSALIEQLAILRLDGDMYESTMVALEALYPKVARGGFVIVDDFKLKRCRAAVEEFRRRHGIDDPIQQIDWTGVYWQRH